ncbi:MULTISPECIES: hypothetical protein [unclassified Roseivivax]|uniref:hypothetical protein n=1 Tax=Roseivivax sp. GX 12232 TaxID=2900547 RepID=UPI001E327229|nr:hypothetical protein [Roseivivax sp. GX 12232]MCE0504431.1 hypothetical protein [Roseivivax sp. GX 12232]
MTYRMLTASTAAAAMLLAGAATAQDEDKDNVAAQAGDVAQEIGETFYAIGETATDTAQAGVGAVGELAEEPYGAAANISAQLDAALTADAVVRSSDGEILGTVTRTDLDGDRVMIDLDGEMEGADERALENAAVQVSSLSAAEGEGDLTLDMTRAEFETALRAAPQASLDAQM